MRKLALFLLLWCVPLSLHAQVPSAPQRRPVPAQTQRNVAPRRAVAAAAAVTHSAALTWVQGVVGAGAVCPGGTGSTAVTGNSIYRSINTGGEGTTPIATIPPATSYTDTTVSPGTTYFYQVTATNCSGESGKSNEASVAIPNTVVPNAPTGLTVTGQ